MSDSSPPEPVDPVTSDLSQMVGQELAAIIPFSARMQEGFGTFGGMMVMLIRAVQRTFRKPAAIGEIAYQVVALGASSTAGMGQGAHPDGVPRSQAYPAQLQRLLNARGCHVKVLNAGKAGDTTRGMLARLPGAMGRDTKVVVFQQGGNDRRKGQSGSGANVAAIQNYVASHGAKMVTMGNLGILAIGFVVSFITAMIEVKTFLTYVTRHGFVLFAWWRVIVGTLGLIALAMGR